MHVLLISKLINFLLLGKHMRSVSDLAALLSQPSKPFEQWQPLACGSLPIEIDSHAKWYYQGSEITRLNLVKLFASVLCKEHDTFYLKTPIEKIAITVADAPFMIVSWRYETTDQGDVLCCVDNLERVWLVTPTQPLIMQNYQGDEVPYLHLPNGCSARVTRSVFYQWAEEIARADEQGYFIQSASQRFYLSAN
jgi:hypothetical protein